MRLLLLAIAALSASLVAPASSSALFSSSAGGEPAVTNTPTNSHFFSYTPAGFSVQYCVNVFRGSSQFERGCIGPYTANGQFSQTETGLADGTVVSTYPTEYRDGIIYPCSGSHCSSSTLIDLNQPVLTVYAAGTAVYTNNPQVPMRVEYYDALSHPWLAGGDAAAVYTCARRDRPCNNADLHTYQPNCSHALMTRFAAPGNPKVNAFECGFNFAPEADGPVYLCATAADQSIPDPDPTANESLSIFPTHANQFINPATGAGWTAESANFAESSCGSVVLDRAPPALGLAASDTTPATGDLVTFSASGTDGLSGLSGPYSWSFGDNTQNKQGASITHTYGDPGTYRVELSAQDGAGNVGSSGVDIVVTTKGGTGGDGTVVKPPSKEEIGGKFGTQNAALGELKVVAPKKYKLAKKPKPLLLTLIASQPGAFQAALTKGSKTVSKGAAVLDRAGTFGFKLKLPKRLAPGTYKLRLTFVPDGAASGSTKTVSVKFFRPPTQRKRQPRARGSAVAGFDGPVNVDSGPPLASNGG